MRFFWPWQWFEKHTGESCGKTGNATKGSEDFRGCRADLAQNGMITGEYGVLSLITPEGEPYGIPLSYVCCGRSLYFHSARDGLKMDCFSVSNKASFVVVGKTMPVYAKNFTTYYESVMVDGVIEHVDDGEKRSALFALAEKYLPEHMDKAEEGISGSWERTAVYALRIDTIIGKAKQPV